MTVNYAPYLRVQENGMIWWQIDDADKLLAGYLPVCSDSQSEVVLRASSNSVIAYHRSLIGARLQKLPGVLEPRLVDHGGEVYVEASEYLGWFSEYLAYSHSKIPFPSELGRLVRDAVNSATDGEDQRFQSLSLALEDWFDLALDSLPDELAKRVQSDLFPLPWDEMSSQQRRAAAEQWDYQHDPATEYSRRWWWNHFVEKETISRNIDEWERIPTLSARDLALKERKLAELRQQLGEIRTREENMQTADSPSAPSTDKIAKPTENSESVEIGRPQVPDCLTNPPSNQDDWFLVICDMVDEFIAENDRCPNPAEAWTTLYDRPPKSYGITRCIDRGDPSVRLGHRTLSRRAFGERWSRYTRSKPQ